MKIQLTFKTPDVVENALIDMGIGSDSLCDNPFTASKEDIKRKIKKKFVEYGEYLRVEYDTETKTMVVKENY